MFAERRHMPPAIAVSFGPADSFALIRRNPVRDDVLVISYRELSDVVCDRGARVAGDGGAGGLLLGQNGNNGLP
jgi:hypothetical protein